MFRRTERADTRQNIRREESTSQRKIREDDKKKKSPADSVIDETEVSINSLVSFLNDMLRENTQSAQEQSFSSMAENMTEPDTQNTKRPQAENKTAPSQAASAYQSTATKIEAPAYSKDNVVKPEDSVHAVTLDSKDRKTLEKFVADLRELSKNGIGALNISRAGTFFESLREAIDLQRTS